MTDAMDERMGERYCEECGKKTEHGPDEDHYLTVDGHYARQCTVCSNVVKVDRVAELRAKVAELDQVAADRLELLTLTCEKVKQLEAESEKLCAALESFDPNDVSAPELRGAQRAAKDYRKQSPKSGQ